MDVPQLMLCARGSAMESYCRERGIDHVAARMASRLNPLFARHVLRCCRQLDADLVHTHDAHGHTAALVAARLFGNTSPIIVSRRVDFPVRSKRKYNDPKVRKIICVSEAIQRIMAEAVSDPSVLTTVHSGIDTRRFMAAGPFNKLRTEYQIPRDALLIGNVAALAPHKDYFTFLDAAKLLVEKKTNAHFVLIGEGALEKQLKDHAKQLGIASHVIFTGFRTDIPEVLPELDVFLVTSETEGLGTSILDAMACKVPVVATAAGGIPEIVQHRETGLLAKVKDAPDLAERVSEMIADEALRQVLVANASHRLRDFTKAAMARKTLEVYQAIL